MEQTTFPLGKERLREFMAILQRYKAGKSATERRILASENWWKLRNTTEEQSRTGIGADGGFVSRSGWLHNVIVSKHADAMESYPEPVILPREALDRQEAKTLSDIIPCVLEQNRFEQTYSDAMWQKLKTGTGVYKVVWDAAALQGLGEISVSQVNLLNLYWEPGITDIQRSRYIFHTELSDGEALEEQYPGITGRLKNNSFMSTRFLYDDPVDTTDKFTVIEVYYHKNQEGRRTLQYCRFVGDQVLYATENDPELARRGLYDHGQFPYVFDPLFPIEGSPCGYGFVDICRNPQTEIDLMKTSFLKNTMAGSVPRYFSRGDGSVNEAEFLDLSRPIVHVNNPGEDSLRQIGFQQLDGVYVNILDRTIQELRQTSGNTESSTGNIQAGVTAASAIAALQEASGKGSRDATLGAYRAYGRIVELCIELIRQFYSLPRQFRILGQLGAEEFVSYTNARLAAQPNGIGFGGLRLPVFDIRVLAQKKNAYSRMAQNELALQFFQNGFFDPRMADQALECLEMMSFDGKDALLRRISRNGQLQKRLRQYMELAMGLAAQAEPELARRIGLELTAMGDATAGRLPVSLTRPEDLTASRTRSANAAVPEAGQ